MATNTIITYRNYSTSSIVNDDGILTWEELKGGSYPWDTNNTIISVTIGTDTSSIGEMAFYYCISLTSIEIPNNVISIGNYAFSECHSLSSITIPNSVSSIGGYTFGMCSSLTSVTIPNSVTSIGTNAFHGCTSLSSIEIPNSVISIANYTFPYCSSLTSITFDKPMSEISSMSNKYWELKTGTKIYASDGIITVTGSNTETSHGYPTVITYTNNTTSSIINEDKILTWQETKGTENYWDENTTIKSVTIGTDTLSIGYSAFQNCTSLSSITIPNSVTSIGDFAFQDCTSLSSIEIPNSIFSINTFTFFCCTSLSSIEIPNSVTSIGQGTFQNCTSLSSIEIPETVESIGDYAFRDCTSLTALTYDKPMSEISSMAYKYWELQTGTKIYASDGIITVTGDETGTFEEYLPHTLITYTDNSTSSIVNYDGILNSNEISNKSTIRSVIIGTDTSSIGTDAFHSCNSLSSIKIPETVESIGVYAFGSCNSLSSITIPTSVSSIGIEAFYYCTSLSSITIPNSVSSIGDYAFHECTSLSSVYFNKPMSEITSMNNKYWRLETGTKIYASDGVITVTGSNTATFKEYTPTIVKYNNGTISSYNINGIISAIEWEHTTQISNITNAIDISVGNNITAIGDYAFFDVSNLSAITLPETIEYIGLYGFSSTKIQTITIPNSVTALNNSVFMDCRSLTSVTIPNSVTSIGKYAFGGCTALTTITFDKPISEVTSMSNKYWSLSAGTQISCTDGVITVVEEIFNYKTNSNNTVTITGLKSSSYNKPVTIPATLNNYSVSSISGASYYYWYYVPSISIENGPTVISSYAFNYCTSLTAVNLPSSILSIGSYAFQYSYKLQSLTIPKSVKYIGSYAFNKCSSLTSLSLPSSLTSIGSYALSACPSTCEITFDRTMSQVSAMSNKYWGINTGAKISCTDGVIFVTGSSSGLPLTPDTKILNTRLILKNDTSSNWYNSNIGGGYIPLQGEPIAIKNTLGWDIVIGDGTSKASSLTSQSIMYKLSSSLSSRDNAISNNLYYLSSTVSQVSSVLNNIQTAGFTTWEGDAGFYNERFYNFENATLNVGNGRIHGMSALTYDAVEAGQYGKSILIPWEVASNNFKTKFLVGKTWMSNRGLGNLPYCQPMMPTDSDYPYINAIPNLESSPLYWGGPMLYSYENNGTTSAMAIQMPWDEVSSYGQEINCPIQGLTNYKLKATKLASQHWVSGAIQQTVLPSMVELSNALTSHIVSCTQADVNLSNKLNIVEQSMPKFLVRTWED